MARHSRRFIVVVLDGVGFGALPDADAYDDAGSNTLGNLARAVGGLHLPCLQRLGLGNLGALQGVPPAGEPSAHHGLMAERSAGKDTTTGHWEMMGLVREHPFPTYPHGFPREVVCRLEALAGRPVLGNRPASGTVIIEELGAEHLRTRSPIVYTSADSVLQVAAHEEVLSLAQLYRLCEQYRNVMQGEHAVGRVIARPFRGRPGSFERTADRRDFSLPPPCPTVLDQLVVHGHGVLGLGKISEIFAGRGVTRSLHTHTNAEALEATLTALGEATESLVFVNLGDFDMRFGHRNDVTGFAQALAELDAAIPELLTARRPTDTLVFTADHGCDPTTPSTDHSREYVPLLVVDDTPPQSLGIRPTFADLGATLCAGLGVPAPSPAGEPLLAEGDPPPGVPGLGPPLTPPVV